MKFALWRLLNDRSMLEISGGSRHDSKTGVTSSFSMSLRDKMTESRGILTISPASNGGMYLW